MPDGREAELLDTAGQPRQAVGQAARWQAALEEWRGLLGAEGVLGPQAAAARFGPNTAGISRVIPAALAPRSAQEVSGLVRIAARHGLPLYPISGGRNWGYGCANPIQDECAIVDCSGMKAIRGFDRDLGLVTVEPGVSQGQLAEYLDRHGLPFLVPTTGAGPEASLLGNALERGYGLTPVADHFAALTALEAVLADGSFYRSVLAEAGGGVVDQAFKWGLGPYLDGLFSQGNLGIVTQGTIALARAPKHLEAFFFQVREEDEVGVAVSAVREILNDLGGLCGSINLMNARRMLSMLERYPAGQVPPGAVMPVALVRELARRKHLTAWTGFGALYGPPGVVRAARAVLRRRLRPLTRRAVFLTPGEVDWLGSVAARIPLLRRSRVALLLNSARVFLQNVSGRPSTAALPLAYWKRAQPPVAGGAWDLSRDGVGLLWYSPLVPMQPGPVGRYVALTERICIAHGMEPLITLTSLSGRCFDSTVPLLFERSDPEACLRAHACYDALFEAGRREGFLPYRLGASGMRHLSGLASSAGRMNARIKRALDPQDLIAPGRYAWDEGPAGEGEDAPLAARAGQSSV